MTEQAQANPSGLMSIGTVASHNIAAVLSLPQESVPQIEQAIKDEIGAMSSHFTLAVADVQTQYEVEVAKIKSDFVWVEANVLKVTLVAFAVFLLGTAFGYLVV